MRTLRLALLLTATVSIAPAVDPGLLSLATPDSKILAGVDVAQVRNSPFGQFLLSRVSERSRQDLERFVNVTGFDPRYDLTEILVAGSGARGRDRLLLARGVFNVPRILSAAEAAGGVRTMYRGVEMLSQAGNRARPGTLAFPGGGLLIAGDPESVRRAIDRTIEGGGGADPALAAKASELSSTNDAWVASILQASEYVPGATDSRNNSPMRAEVLRAIEQGSAGVKFGDTVLFTGELHAKTAQDATSLADVIRFLAGMMTMNQKDPRAAILDSLQVNAVGETVNLSLKVPQQTLEMLIQQPPRLRIRPAPRGRQ